ncbi:uncharacterized protein PV09_03215 [Verruconis gallopava]|uniref:Ubiquitin-like protease family profile domain-containing protein n=1 Tax=Verruconis gallopava TaxID=253628 RepID=A0A0D2B4A7_9PEZI|nr:uncharacterized protein PV09_03215 [Verruconis gallopava]KIW06039.1 hypothetical protein PV09_03215 [Verruconis gallopava]
MDAKRKRAGTPHDEDDDERSPSRPNVKRRRIHSFADQPEAEAGRVESGDEPDASESNGEGVKEPPESEDGAPYSSQNILGTMQREAAEQFAVLLRHFRCSSKGAHEANPFVSPFADLNDDQVVVAIMAVTEAIRDRGGAHAFDVTAQSRVQVAKFDGLTEPQRQNIRSLRPRRPLLLPWLYNPVEQRYTYRRERGETGEGDTMADACKEIQRAGQRRKAHIFLVLVHMQLDVCELRFFDSYPDLPFRSGDEWRRVGDTIRTLVSNVGWFRDVDDPGDQGGDVVFGPEVDVRVAQQGNGWACGLHTILNAWTVAMNLVPNPNFRVLERGSEASHFYTQAAEVVNLVVAGHADSDLIYSYLVGYGFALPQMQRGQCPRFGLLADLHDIRNVSSLEEGIKLNHAIEESLVGVGVKAGFAIESTTGTTSRQSGQAGASSSSYERADDDQDTDEDTSERDYVDPTVLADEEFANLDCMSVWRVLHADRSKQQLPARYRNVVDGSSRYFRRFYMELLSPEFAACSDEQVKISFDRARLEFEALMNFEAFKYNVESKGMMLTKQLAYYRQMAQGFPISQLQRRQLRTLYAAFAREVQAARAAASSAQRRNGDGDERPQNTGEERGAGYQEEHTKKDG